MYKTQEIEEKKIHSLILILFKVFVVADYESNILDAFKGSKI